MRRVERISRKNAANVRLTPAGRSDRLTDEGLRRGFADTQKHRKALLCVPVRVLSQVCRAGDEQSRRLGRETT